MFKRRTATFYERHIHPGRSTDLTGNPPPDIDCAVFTRKNTADVETMEGIALR